MADWKNIFSEPGEWVDVTFTPPEHSGTLTRVAVGDLSSLGGDSLVLVVRELGEGAATAWAREGGWPAFGTRVRALAEALGGAAEQQTFRAFVSGVSRHEVRYVGPKREDL